MFGVLPERVPIIFESLFILVELPRATLATRLVLADSLILPVIDLLRGRFAATGIR